MGKGLRTGTQLNQLPFFKPAGKFIFFEKNALLTITTR